MAVTSSRSGIARNRISFNAKSIGYGPITGGGPPMPKMWPIPCSMVVTMVWMTCRGISSVRKVLITASGPICVAGPDALRFQSVDARADALGLRALGGLGLVLGIDPWPC
jgi:hypothetical protein